MWTEILSKVFDIGSHKTAQKLLRRLSKIYNFTTDHLFFPGKAVTRTWRNTWLVTLILCAGCIFLSRPFLSRPWIGFLPAALISDAVLIQLCRKARFPERVAFWRLGFLPVLGVWVPYLIRLLIGDPDSGPLAFLFQKFNLPRNLVFLPAQDYSEGWMHYSPQLTCALCTVAILVTARIFGTGAFDLFAPAHLEADKPARAARTSERAQSRRAQRGQPSRSEASPISVPAPPAGNRSVTLAASAQITPEPPSRGNANPPGQPQSLPPLTPTPAQTPPPDQSA